MQASLEITFRGMPPSPAASEAVAEWVKRLEHIHDRIQHCHVWIDQPHRHRRRGSPFQVKIALAVPGAEPVVTHHEDSDVYLALADAFLAARRQLHELARIRRGDIKHHTASP
jgi:ribosome-associated translation inhibitor RaiA